MLREQKLQFLLNIEIGNLTLGSAACCHTKDSLDGVEFGQVNSYVTAVKWVTRPASCRRRRPTMKPELLPLIKSSYGLAGIIYEVTFRIKPLEIVKFDYDIHEATDLTEARSPTSSRRTSAWSAGRSATTW